MSARPPSTRPGTAIGRAASTYIEDMGEWVVAVIQGRGAGVDVGIAAFDITTGKTVITQLSDGQTFPKTLHHISLHPPCTLLVPDTFLPTSSSTQKTNIFQPKRNDKTNRGNKYGKSLEEPLLIVQYLEERFDLDVGVVGRKWWDRGEGMQTIQKYIIEDDIKTAVLMAADKKHYALSAIAALYRFLETTHAIEFAQRSQRIVYQALEGTMLIDPDTAKNLELVQNVLNFKSNQSLYGVLNMTQTKMAQRLLKSTILQPSIDPDIVEGRLDVVEELVRSGEVYKGLKDGLKAFTNMDLEKLISQLSQTSKKHDPKAAENRISQLLQLRLVMRSVGPLIDALSDTGVDLLIGARQLLSDPRCETIDELIGERLNDDAISHSGKAQNQKALRIYAVRANFNKLLDVARETHKENVEDIYELKTVLTEAHDLPLELKYSEKGFEFTLKANLLDESLPKNFTGVRKSGARYLFTCSDLLKLNARMKSAEEEVFLMSDNLILDLRDKVVEHIACLYNLSEVLAKLDMLVSFAQVAIAHKYIRPEFKGALAIKGGKHPILQKYKRIDDCIPNDIYAAEKHSCFLLIQGPNMSGKSTYLRQTALLTVMAMCGSFVPATYASFRYHDALLSRLSNDDSIERSLSTFAVEMSTSAMVLGLATEKSLVLIDELGRGTAPSEGAGISHAIAEELIDRKSFVLFATHFKDLAQTLAVYPSVEILHLHTSRKKDAKPSEHALIYEHVVVRGSSREEHYGIELAKMAALPEDVMDTAMRVSKFLSESETKGRAGSETNALALRRKAMLALQSQLEQVATHSSLPPKELREYLIRLQRQCVAKLMEAKKLREEGLKLLEFDNEVDKRDSDDDGKGDTMSSDSGDNEA